MANFLDIIFDLFLAVMVARVLAAAFRRLFGSATIRFSHSASSPHTAERNETVRGETVRDPVCGMFVSTELAHRLNWRGQALYFCSKECLERYRRNASS